MVAPVVAIRDRASMTLLVAYSPQKFPVLIGDLLLSGKETNGKVTEIPTIGESTQVFPEGCGWAIAGLNQKLVRISDNCILGWSGSRLTALSAIKAIRALQNDRGTLTYSDVQCCVDNLDAELANKGIALVGWIRDEKGIRGFEIGGRTIEIPGHGRAYAAGSGAELFETTVKAIVQDANVTAGNPNPLEFAVSHAFSMVGVLLSHESITGESLLHLFGGGYEIASLVRGKFAKLGDLTYVLWRVSVDDTEGVSLSPYFVVKQEYRDDALLLYRSLPLFDQDQIKMEESVFVVRPFGTRFEPSQLSRNLPHLNSTFTCNIFINVVTGEARSRLDYSAAATPKSVRFLQDNGQTTVSINHDFLVRITEQFS